MLNLNDYARITRNTTGVDTATGIGTAFEDDVFYNAVRCSLVPLRADEVVSAWADVPDAVANRTYADLILPSWLPLLPEDGHSLTDYTVSVSGWPWTWRISAANVWPNFTKYLVVANP